MSPALSFPVLQLASLFSLRGFPAEVLPSLIFIFIFLDGVSLFHPGWSIVAQFWLAATSAFQFSIGSPASASLVAGITGAHHHTRLIFVFLAETGFHRIGQAGLELLTL